MKRRTLEEETKRALLYSCQMTCKQLSAIGVKFYKADYKVHKTEYLMLGNAIVRLAWMEKQERKLYKLLNDIGIEVGCGDVIDKLRKYIRDLRRRSK